MARIRNVKPSIWKHEVLHDAEYYTGLPLVVGFISLWSICDREGRFKWKVRSLKSDCMPLRDDVNFEAVLDSLHSLGMISKKYCNGEYYGVVVNFSEHQAISTSEKSSAVICLEGCQNIEPKTLDEIIEKFNLNPVDSSRFPEGQTKDRLKSDTVMTNVCQTKDVGQRTKDVGQRTKDIKTDSIESNVKYKFLSKIPKKYHDDICEVLEYWANIMDQKSWPYDGDNKIDYSRAKIVMDSLKREWPVSELKRAIDGCKANSWYMGKHPSNSTPRNDVKYILTNEKIKEHLASTERTLSQVPSYETPTLEEFNRLRQGEQVDFIDMQAEILISN